MRVGHWCDMMAQVKCFLCLLTTGRPYIQCFPHHEAHHAHVMPLLGPPLDAHLAFCRTLKPMMSPVISGPCGVSGNRILKVSSVRMRGKTRTISIKASIRSTAIT